MVWQRKGLWQRMASLGKVSGFPSRCGVRGCQVALLEDQRGRAHVKDTSEAYCPALELSVFMRTCCTTPGYAVSATRLDTDSGVRTGLSSRRTRSYSQNSLISFAKTCLLTQPEFWMRDARPGHKTSGRRLRAKMLPFNVASWITPWGGRARSVEGVVDRAIELT